MVAVKDDLATPKDPTVDRLNGTPAFFISYFPIFSVYGLQDCDAWNEPKQTVFFYFTDFTDHINKWFLFQFCLQCDSNPMTQ